MAATLVSEASSSSMSFSFRLSGTAGTVVRRLRGRPQNFPRVGRSGSEREPNVTADAGHRRAAVSEASIFRALASSASCGPNGSSDSNPCSDASLIGLDADAALDRRRSRISGLPPPLAFPNELPPGIGRCAANSEGRFASSGRLTGACLRCEAPRSLLLGSSWPCKDRVKKRPGGSVPANPRYCGLRTPS